MINELFEGKKEEVNNQKNYELNIDFDFPGWLAESELPLEKFYKNTKYKIIHDLDKINNLRKELASSAAAIETDKERLNDRLVRALAHGSEMIERSFKKLN